MGVMAMMAVMGVMGMSGMMGAMTPQRLTDLWNQPMPRAVISSVIPSEVSRTNCTGSG